MIDDNDGENLIVEVMSKIISVSYFDNLSFKA